ncbi:hypothetical protein GPX89_17005 [Nocardia sp. ET3-3]|uniref:Uncharacterized protein n=1 Tax=Nocardia terrae TaxID=2675851 RepID=A0A7K1UYF7_9NOCA|nr:hypothetical protein [Nocardia terrae]MVU78938.1 hypothetical protein [Nocardia terrae]
MNREILCATGNVVFGVLALALTAATLTGCGGQVNGTPAAGEVDVRQLPVGNYPIEPLDLRVEYLHSTNDGYRLAMARLADAVVTGVDIDPKFAHNSLAKAFLNTGSATNVLAAAVQPALRDNGMKFGYSASASTDTLLPIDTSEYVTNNYEPFGGHHTSPDATSFNVTVLQFPDSQRARAAAEQSEAADFAVAPDQNVRVALDKQQDAKAHWRPGIPSLAATLAYGDYVVNVYVELPKPDLDGLRQLTEQIFAAQLPLLDRTPPLSERQIFHLDYDPDAMLLRTLHPATYLSLDAVTEITHAARGYLHYVEDQATMKRLMDDSGVDRVSTTKKGALLFRARDTGSATTLWSGITKLDKGSVESPAGVPDVACVENPNPKPHSWDFDNAWNDSGRYICTLHYDRYVARVASGQLIDAQQKAAAQYALLANSQWM